MLLFVFDEAKRIVGYRPALVRMRFAHRTSVDLHCVGLWLSRVRRCGVSMRPFVQLHAFALFR